VTAGMAATVEPCFTLDVPNAKRFRKEKGKRLQSSKLKPSVH